MQKLANHIIYIANKNALPLFDEEPLREMYDEQFEVWTYGPVIRQQYSRFKRFASEFIIGDFEQNPNLTPLNSIILELFQVNVFTLVELSIRTPFWIQNRDKIKDGMSDIKYDFDDI